MREVIKQAATVDEAIELALKELNLEREDVTAEVLEYPGKKLFFKTPAKVKISELEPDSIVKDIFSGKVEEKPKQQPQREEKPASRMQREAPRNNSAPQNAATRTPAPRREYEKETYVEVPISEVSDKARHAMDFLQSVVGQVFDGEYKMQPVKTQAGYIIKIMGSDAGCLIGRKGETMEALSYLTSLAANRSDDNEEKISVDVADYREKREKDLQIVAKKMALKVVKYGRPYIFEPMNPYERRIIHATVGEIEGVKSESKGEGSQRRVAIYSTAPRKPRPEGDKPAYVPRPEGNKPAYAPRPEGDKPAYAPRPEGDKPAYAPRPEGDKPAYVPRPEGDKPAYAPRPEGDKPAYAPRPYSNDRSGSKPPYNRNSRDRGPVQAQKTRDEKLVDNAGTALYSKIDLE